VQDCAGVWDGDVVLDECGICNGSGIAEGFCDCAGNVDLGCGCSESGPSGCDNVCGSTLENDECGICGGDNSPSTGTCDCAGIPNGDSWISDCGCVSLDNSGDDCDDCAGMPNGDSIEDNCGICDADDTNDCVQDCVGEWGGEVDWCYGCTDENAVNYNSETTIDDGSCINFDSQIVSCFGSMLFSTNVTIEAKIANYSSVSIIVSGLMFLNNENMVIFAQDLNSELQSMDNFLYNMNLPYPPSGNGFDYIMGGYKIIWQFEYNGSIYQTIYNPNGLYSDC